MIKFCAVFVCCLLAGSPAFASASSPLAEAMAACKRIKAASSRLNCYDAISANKELLVPPASTQFTEDDFGATDLKSRQKQVEAEKPKRMTSGIVELGTNRSGKYFFVLANGQTWIQAQSETHKLYIPKKLSNVNVVIKRTIMGGHTLKIEGKKQSIKVKRLR